MGNEKAKNDYRGLMSKISLPIILILTILKIIYKMDNEFIFTVGILCISITALLFIMSILKVNDNELGVLKLIGISCFFTDILRFIFIEISYLLKYINIILISDQILIFIAFINIILSIVIYYKNYSQIIQLIFILLQVPLVFFIVINEYRGLKYIYYFCTSKSGSMINLFLGIILLLSILYLYKRFNLNNKNKWIIKISLLLSLSNVFLYLNIYLGMDFSYFIGISKLISYFLLYSEFEKKLLNNVYSSAHESLNKVKEIKRNLNKSLKKRENQLNELNLLLKKSEKNYQDVVKAFSKGLIIFENEILIYSDFSQEIFYINNIKVKLIKNKTTFNELLTIITGRSYIDEEEGKDFYFEVNIKEKFGIIRDYEIHLVKIQDNKKYLVFYDVTEILKQRKEIAKLEKKIKAENIKDEFYSNISHELRTPINVVYSALQLNDIYLKDNKLNNIMKNNNIVKQNCLRLIRTINNFIDSNKLSEGFLDINVDTYNIVDIIENVILACNYYMKLKYTNLVYDPQYEEIYVECDKDYIERVMLNILSNSLKHGKDYGNIYVSTKIENNKIVIEVMNDAETIPDDKRSVIFEKFTKINTSLNRPSEGSGLGLYLTKGLVELHDGEISINPGTLYGNIYKIVLPYNRSIQAKGSYLSKNIEISDLQQKVDIEFSDIYF